MVIRGSRCDTHASNDSSIAAKRLDKPGFLRKPYWNIDANMGMLGCWHGVQAMSLNELAFTFGRYACAGPRAATLSSCAPGLVAAWRR